MEHILRCAVLDGPRLRLDGNATLFPRVWPPEDPLWYDGELRKVLGDPVPPAQAARVSKPCIVESTALPRMQGSRESHSGLRASSGWRQGSQRGQAWQEGRRWWGAWRRWTVVSLDGTLVGDGVVGKLGFVVPPTRTVVRTQTRQHDDGVAAARSKLFSPVLMSGSRPLEA